MRPVDFFQPDKRPDGRKLVWMKALFPIREDDTNLHRCLAAFASDWGLGASSLLPHGITFPSHKLKVYLAILSL